MVVVVHGVFSHSSKSIQKESVEGRVDAESERNLSDSKVEGGCFLLKGLVESADQVLEVRPGKWWMLYIALSGMAQIPDFAHPFFTYLVNDGLYQAFRKADFLN